MLEQADRELQQLADAFKRSDLPGVEQV
jgi:hypothetical protein